MPTFKNGDRFYLKHDNTRYGKVIRLSRSNEFGTDLATWDFTYYVVEMDNGSAPIQTNYGGIASENEMIKIIDTKKNSTN